MPAQSKLREARLWLGSLVMAVGGAVILVSADIISADDSSFNAPRWIVGLAGGLFLFAGAMVFIQDQRFSYFRDTNIYRVIRFVNVGLLLTIFGVIPTWLAFGPGERQFSGGISIPFISISSDQGELSGRFVFGCGAIIMDLAAVGYWISGIRRLISTRPHDNDNL